MPGLREQWRRTAMTTIQERALDLFDERGFAAVTIEEIAVAAEVSPSSVYRYFGTKEGILVADEFDLMNQEELVDLLDPANPVEGLLQAVRAYESVPQGETEAVRSPWRRVRYFFAEPSVRMAVLANIDRASQRYAPLLASHGDLSETQARVVSNALAFGYFAALERWYLDGGVRPIADYVEEGLAPLRRMWPSTDG